MGRKKSAIELHSFHNVDVGFGATSFFDSDHAVFADFQEGIGQNATDRGIVVPGDRGDLLNLFFVLLVNRHGLLIDRIRNRLGCFSNPARQCHRVITSGDHFQTFAENRFGQNRGGGCSVSGDVVGLTGGLFDQLHTQVLERVIQFDIFGDSHTIFGDFGRTPAFVQNSVAAARAKCAADGFG